jgi:hypothetical protein
MDTAVADSAYYYNQNITEAVFPYAVTIGTFAFIGCRSLTTADFPVATTVGESAFSGCKALTDVNFPELETVGKQAFQDCDSLTKIVLPKVKTIINGAFQNCDVLKIVDLGANLSSLGGSSNSDVFKECPQLSALVLRSENVFDITLHPNFHFGNAYVSAGNIYIYVPSALVDSYKAHRKWSAMANQFRALEDYTVDGTITGALDESKI